MTNKTEKSFTTPIICKPANGEWFIFFRYRNPKTGKLHPIKRSEQLNRIHDRKEKDAEFKALLTARKAWLEMGWNPLDDPTFIQRPLQAFQIDRLQLMSFSEALDFAFEKKKPDWAHKTCLCFDSCIRYLKEAAAATGSLHMPVVSLKRPHYRDMLERAKVQRGFSAKGFNKYRQYLSCLIGELVQYDVLEYNVIEKIERKSVLKTIAHRPPTQDQRVLIVNRIRNDYRPYYRFLAIEYGCTIRPKEITGLKIKHLHRLEQIFRLTPDNQSSMKTKVERDVTIPDWVMDLLAEINLHTYDPEWYIFSTHNKYGSFLPGPKRMHVNTSTTWWRNIVKKGLGLDINQYSLKKLSGNDMVRLQRREGVDKLLELPREQMGHAETRMTEVYVTEHLDIMKELVKRKMPAIVKPAVDTTGFVLYL